MARKRPTAVDPEDEPGLQLRRMQDDDGRTARQARGRVAARKRPVKLSQEDLCARRFTSALLSEHSFRAATAPRW